MENVVNRSVDLLHPAIRFRCVAVEAAAADAFKSGIIPVPLKIFETYRSPERQAQLRRNGVSKALPFQSAHQFGLACDFVPRPDGKWSWDGPGCDVAFRWLRLNVNSGRFGPLVSNISWDWPHVEYRDFASIANALKLAAAGQKAA